MARELGLHLQRGPSLPDQSRGRCASAPDTHDGFGRGDAFGALVAGGLADLDLGHDHDREVGHALQLRHRVRGVFEDVPHHGNGGDAGLLESCCVEQTARGARPSHAHAGDGDLDFLRHLLDE